MVKRFITNTIPQLSEACKTILAESKSKIFLLYGDLGSGKTTFVKECCKQLGISDSEVSSPTFSLQNTYSFGSIIVQHFDLYRLKSLEEFEQLGIEEFISSSDYCFIEWPKFIDEINTHTTKVFFIFDSKVRSLEVVYEG